METAEIARLCHEANRAICEAAGDTSQKPWFEAELWQRESAIRRVEFVLANPSVTPSSQHDALMAATGWGYGPTKDAAAKTHPCVVPYDQLPFELRVKDHVFRAIALTIARTAWRAG